MDGGGGCPGCIGRSVGEESIESEYGGVSERRGMIGGSYGIISLRSTLKGIRRFISRMQ